MLICFFVLVEILQKAVESVLAIDEQLSNTEDWTKLIDRGGLTHVNDNTYMLFHSMELEVRKHLKSSVTSTQKKQIVDSVCENDDVLFYGAC